MTAARAAGSGEVVFPIAANKIARLMQTTTLRMWIDSGPCAALHRPISIGWIVPIVAAMLIASSGCVQRPADAGDDASGVADDEPSLHATVTGFAGPEAVRYDPEQDVYFVANFNGPGDAADNNGFISRMTPEGDIESLKFIEGGQAGLTLHAPRGMVLSGDTLWVADHGAVRGFDRSTGAPLANVDFSDRDHGFLNDVTIGPDGSLYVTDTGRDQVVRIAGGRIDVVFQDSLLDRPNGITWDAARNRFIVVPYGGTQELFSWEPDDKTLQSFASTPGGGFDGVEVLPSGDLIIASQTDSSLHLVLDGVGRALVALEGRPADIGFDSERNRVAVPYISRNSVEIWQLAP